MSAPAIRFRAVSPSGAGTSSTSKTRPVARMTFASGRAVHSASAIAGSVVASTCQAAEIGCAPGAGQPIRSHEQPRTAPAPRCGRAGGGYAPAQTGQPMAA